MSKPNTLVAFLVALVLAAVSIRAVAAADAPELEDTAPESMVIDSTPHSLVEATDFEGAGLRSSGSPR